MNRIDDIGNNEIKKAWIVPELEVLDGRKTYGGTQPDAYEDEWDDVKDAES